jgi:hypothetical protein
MSNEYEVGDIICFGSVPPYHYAVYIGDGEIVHYNKDNKLDGKPCIKREKITEYEKRKGTTYPTAVVAYSFSGAKYPAETIIERALRNVGHGDYNLWSKNCEHFATWVVYGRDISGQSRAAGVVGGTVATAITGAVTGAAVGSVVPVVGTAVGTGVGAVVGGGVGVVATGIRLGRAFASQQENNSNFFTTNNN